MGLLGHASVPSSMASSKLLINYVCMHRGVSELTPPGLSLAQSSPRPLQGPLQSPAINTRRSPPPPPDTTASVLGWFVTQHSIANTDSDLH